MRPEMMSWIIGFRENPLRKISSHNYKLFILYLKEFAQLLRSYWSNELSSHPPKQKPIQNDFIFASAACKDCLKIPSPKTHSNDI